MKKLDLISNLKKAQDLLFDIVQNCKNDDLRKKLLKIMHDLEEIEIEEATSYKKNNFY